MVFSILRIVFGLLLTLFIPGFAVTLVVFPRDLGRVERVALSCVLSIATVLLTALLLDLVLGVDITAENMVVALLSLSAFFFLVYIILNRRYTGLFKHAVGGFSLGLWYRGRGAGHGRRGG